MERRETQSSLFDPPAETPVEPPRKPQDERKEATALSTQDRHSYDALAAFVAGGRS